MSKKKKDVKKSCKIKIICKIIIFIFLTFLLVSLFTHPNNIFNDYEVLNRPDFSIKSLFSAERPIVANPIGIIGSFFAYHIVYFLGQIFAITALSVLLIHLILGFASQINKPINKFFLFLLWNIINVYMLSFYMPCFTNEIHTILWKSEISTQIYPNKIVFQYIYLFLVAIIGKIGILIFILTSFLLSLRLIFPFNPFKISVNFFMFLYNLIKKDDEDEEHELNINQPEDNIDTTVATTPTPHNIENIECDDPQTEEKINYLEEPEQREFIPPKKKFNPIVSNGCAYQKPDIDLFLYKPSLDKRVDKSKLDAEIKAVSQLLKDKLAEFNIEAFVLNVNVGPIITQYELEPAPGIKVNRFTSLSDDLALALKAKSIRVQAPIPGRGLIGVEVPNKNADIIYMRDIFFSQEMYNSDAILSVALGKDIAGRPIVTDLAKTPHLLIAGATGSGKSVCINTIICSILLRSTPEEVRLVMIDPKRIELSGYEGIPHLIQSVVTEPEEAMNTLTWAVYEMERRYELLQELKVRDIISYNQKIEDMLKKEEAEEIDKLPYIVLIVDEFADLIMTAGREIELPIARLAQMARAIGIHIILATQRPSIKVITGVIKANFPARIAFRVSSKVDSRVILDSTGADKLLGRGDMLFLPPGKPNPERIHGAYLSDSEIEGLVEYLRTQPKPKLTIEMSKPEVGNISDFEYDDDLFPEAARVIVSTNLASVSMLQRHFKIGYARAGRLIDLLERAGVIGPHLGSKPREVLMTKEDIEGI
ncbi:MAG: FtsK/SpoIIIE domain-containing protein [Candidatus Cloacimonetes bacterium]|nr:FtsK/SpoIIIE domain-containing protein [Candidatus Cloacimonadota bacterium]